MDSETQRAIKEAVIEILRDANMEEMTEYKVRTLTADRLGINLSTPELKRFVRSVVESFLASHEDDVASASITADAAREEEQHVEVGTAEEEEEEEEEEDGRRRKRGRKEYDDEGNLIVCRVSD